MLSTRDLKRQCAGESRAKDAAERQLHETQRELARAEQGLRSLAADRDRWRRRAEAAEAALAAMGARP